MDLKATQLQWLFVVVSPVDKSKAKLKETKLLVFLTHI
jgi:hypothetical protein